MALSQVQCLDDNHINLRTNESKPEFFYSEEQRIALETLIHDGQDAFEDYIKTKNIRCFLSDLELERIINTAEVYCPGSPDNNAELYGESDGEELSLQYWPDRSDCSIPQLDIGWMDRVSYRGVTRVQVYTQPPYEGQSHIKEVVRKMIGQAQKVIAVVMDMFTDIDIFKDLLDASYKRKVAVYIILEATAVKHFLRMCEKAGMHTGHLKNLRVRSIRGPQFFSRSSKKVCGSQSQKFMFIDGDKAVSGSYSFTWSASRLDRNLITVLTGQAVDTFDTLFQDMYVMSNGVCLSKINLSSEPEPEFLSQVVPTPLPSAIKALKLINPKYTLVSNCAFTSNGPVSDQTNPKNQTEVIKQIKDTPVVPSIHPGLLNLEKANMINYVPTWPDPDPSSDVIGFINIRDSKKPLQAHLMRSELFEVSQAIRFKNPFHEPKESIYLRPCLGPISQTPSDPEAPAQKQTPGEAQKNYDQNQHQTSSRSEDLILPSDKPETVHVLACNKVDKEELCAMENNIFDISTSLQSKNIHAEKDCPNAIPNVPFTQEDRVSDTKETLDTPQPLKCLSQTSDNLDMISSSAVYNKTQCDLFAIPDTPFVKQSLDDQVLIDVVTQEHRDTKPETNQNGWNGTQMSNCDSSISSLSDVYYDCFSPVADLRAVGDFSVPEKTQESLYNPIEKGHQEQEVPRSNPSLNQDHTDSDNKQTLFTPKLLKSSCSIVFNFLSTEFKTRTTPSEANFAQESDKGIIINDSKIPVKDRETCYFSQTPNGCFNFSSTSEEYFECSDTVGLNSDIHGMVHEKPSSVENFNLNDPLHILTPVLEAEKLSELGCQNIKEKDEPKMDSGLEITADSRLVTNEIMAVLGSEANTQTQLDEKVLRHQEQMSEVLSEPVVESKSISDFLQAHEISVSREILEIQTKAESLKLSEKVEKEPVQDLQLDVSLDKKFVQLAEKNSKPQLQDLESDVSRDVKCVKLAEKNSKPQLQDLESDVSRDVKCVKLAEKTPNLQLQDLVSDVSRDVKCVKLAEKTANLQLQDLESDVSRDVKFVKLAEKTAKLQLQDLESDVSRDVKCVKLAEKTANLQLQDLESDVSRDVKFVKLAEKTAKLQLQDLESDVSRDVKCVKLAEKTANLQLQDLESDVSRDVKFVKLAEKTAKLQLQDLESDVSRDVKCVKLAEKTANLQLQDLESDVSRDVKFVKLAEKTAKLQLQDLESDVSRDVKCVKLAEKTANLQLQDLESDVSRDVKCVKLAEKTAKLQLQDLESDVSRDVKCVGQSVKLAEKTAKLPLQDLQPEVILDLICEGQFVQLPETTTKLPQQDAQSEESPDLILKPSEVNAISKPHFAKGSESRSSILQVKADITSVISEETKVTKSVELPKSEEMQNPLTYLDSGSNLPSCLISEEHVNELQNDEASPAVLKINSDEHNPQEELPELFETIKLLILEDSDPQETELNNSDPIRRRAALSKEAKLSKTEPIEPKTANDRKRKEKKQGHDSYSRNKKETCHPTTLVEKKQEREHICTNQMNKNLPEAKSKLESLVRKQPHQRSSRIPIQARGGLPKLTISKADTRSFGLQAPKAGLHSKLPSLGKPLGQNKPSLTLLPSPEKLSIGGIAPVRSTQIPQRPSQTVPSPHSPISPLKQPRVQLIAPRIRQSDQPNVSRKRSASITKCSSSGILSPGQVKKQAYKGSPPSN